MSGPNEPKLDDLVREAKEAFDPERTPNAIDWAKIEARLMPRVEREARAAAAIEAHRGSRRWLVVGGVIAAAAAIPLLLTRTPSAPFGATAEQSPERAASGLAWKDAHSVVTVKRAPAEQAAERSSEALVGDSIARGDAIDVHGGRVVFERSEPGAVTWGLEDGAHVVVRASRGPIVVALEKGAVEAQVAPVADGEAFAVDVEGARVAVHGTHLRVAREGARVVVDLSEGVVSIGLPPKSGSTYGDLVTAPAHVEFDPADPHGTLKVSHEAARVRAVATLGPPTPPAPAHSVVPVTPPRPTPAARPAVVLAPAAPPPPPVVLAPPPVVAPAAPAPSPQVAPPLRVDPNPDATITNAVRACARKEPSPPDGLVITITSRLALSVGDSGLVDSARFDPPLPEGVQKCASPTIFGTRFSTPGAVSIPIDFTP